MAVVHLVQHAQKQPEPGDPGLTALGHEQAALAARWLRWAGVRAVWSSPSRRARETASAIAAATGLAVRLDDRLRERMNWTGAADFAEQWERTTHDRDFIPDSGDSSRLAGARLLAFVTEHSTANDGSVAAVTHGGVTVDLLRTLLGDDAVPAGLLQNGIPPGAITTLDASTVVGIAETGHLWWNP
jgi:broad specificity phosphatase PhoE